MLDTQVFTVIRSLEFLTFLWLARVGLRAWRRDGVAVAKWLVLASVLAALVMVFGIFKGPGEDLPAGSVWDWLVIKPVVLALVVVPACLFEMALPVMRRRRLLERAMFISLGILGGVTVLVPEFPRGDVEPDGVFWPLYSGAFALHWIWLCLAAAVSLYRGGRGQPTLARRRMKTLSIASSLFATTMLLGSFISSDGPTVAVAVNQTFTILSIASFALAFAMPAPLRFWWRQPEMSAFSHALAALTSAASQAEVAAVILRPASRLLGSSRACLLGHDGQVLAAIGFDGDPDDEALATMLTGEGIVSVAVQPGRLIVPVTPLAPFFGPEELELLGALAAAADGAFERARRYEDERRRREELSEREQTLLDAQRQAQLGDWTWRGGTDLVWSPTLYQLLGLCPDRPPSLETLLSVVHPDDRQVFLDSVAQLSATAGQQESMFRIVRDDGVRWIHGTADVELDSNGHLTRAKGTLQDVTTQKQAEQLLLYRAHHDPLTGLPNRGLLAQRLEHALARARRSRTQVSVLWLDLDRFKVVNDGLGHTVGDQLLVAVADRLRRTVRPGDTVARFGGDEFVVVAEDLGTSEAGRLAQRIVDAFSVPFPLVGRQLSTTASVGVVVVDGERRPETMLRDADAAMYRAKSKGRNRFELSDAEVHREAMARLEDEAALRKAIEEGELTLRYQPQVDLRSGEVVGIEALVRWLHPQRGLLGPNEFLPLSEEAGLINALGWWVVGEACRAAARWRASGSPYADVTMWINVSPSQLVSEDFADQLSTVLAVAGLPATSFGIELTEHVMLSDDDIPAQNLAAITRSGVQLAIDDFGTGFSSMAHLRRLPASMLKIDRSFTSGVADVVSDREIVRSIVSLARSVGVAVVAEGVETEAQADVLVELGCDVAQGFWLAHPATELELHELPTRLCVARG